MVNEQDNNPSIVIDDLNAQDAEEIKGGLLLPAVQKVREAALVAPTAHSSGSLGTGKVSLNDIS